MRIEAFVPMRGGSKEIPLKNIKEFCGKPLCYWVIRELQKTDLISKIVISTDSDEILDVVNDFGFDKCTFFRQSDQSAMDDAMWEEAVSEYLEMSDLSKKDILVMTQVTSPFTLSEHFRDGINLYKYSVWGDSVVTCSRTHRFFWDIGINDTINYNYFDRPRRQDFPGMLVENGAFCINSVESFIEDNNRLSGDVIIYEMPPHTIVEIDSDDDWYYAEYLMRKYVLS